MELKRYMVVDGVYGAEMIEHATGDWCDFDEVQHLSQHGFFLARDNNDPQQLWVWKGVPGDETAEPWMRVQE